MGLLRLLLATMVIFIHAGHLPGFPTMGGSLAVQTFYMISGFYMALILNEKYVAKPQAYRLFLTNRVLRLLPIYYIAVSLTLLTATAMALTIGRPELEFFRALGDNYDRLSISAIAFITFTNLTLIGQDWLSFLSIDPATGMLMFTSDFNQSTANLNSLLLVQPGWTISLELTFYLIAPFVVRRSAWVLLLLILVSAMIKFSLSQYANLNSMAWSYRFFPSELMYFVAGALAYKAYRRLKNTALPVWLCPLALSIAIVYTFFFGLIFQELVALGLSGGVVSALYRITIAFTLPFVFLYTKHSQFDTKIGELSYPVYILHFLVWESLTAWKIGGTYVNLYTLVITLAIAFALNRLIGERVEQVRQRVFAQHSPVQPSMA